MREIKFRGKRLVDDAWIVGFYYSGFQDNSKAYILSVCDGIVYEVDPYTVGQFTGLTDKDGFEIFEGDLLDKKYKWVVKWFKGEFITESSILGTVVENIFLKIKKRIKAGCPVEIIGNIHDNPELLR